MENHTDLIGGPYRAPAVGVGDWLTCAIAGRVQVIGWSEGPIAWPVRRSTGIYGRTFILCGDLAAAVRTESNVALCHWFGACQSAVLDWRRALGVSRRTPGTQRLQIRVGHENLDETTRAKACALAHQPDILKKMGAAVAASHARRAAWKPEEEALLGTMPDAQTATRLGRSYTQVWNRRRALGIATYERDANERATLYRAAVAIVAPCSHALHERRQRLGLLQREVAARAGLSPTTYTLIESGARTSIRRETLERIAAALECAPATLIDDTIA